MAHPRTALVLAGGLGTRLRSVVPDLPKPMAPIEGRPFLAYLMDYWMGQGIERFILSVGYRHEAISEYFGNQYRGAAVEYVVEQTPLGTGGGVLLAAPLLEADAPFLLLNGDTYFAVPLAELAAFREATDADWAFSLFPTLDSSRYMAMDVADGGAIHGLHATKPGARPLANGGVYLVHPRALLDIYPPAGARLSLEQEMFPLAISAGQRMFGQEFGGDFIDIGVPDDYARASAILL